MSRSPKNRLYGIVERVRAELDIASEEIDDMPDDTGELSCSADIEEMRSRLGALELRVQVIEGGIRA